MRQTRAVIAPMLAFRSATTDDVDRVVELVESAYRGEPSRAGWTTEADLLGGRRTDAEAVTGLMARPGSLVLLADDARGLAACCHLERRPDGTAYFGMFAVRPAAQGGGIGRAVVAEAIRRSLEWGAAQLRMTVIRQRDDLIAWYRRLGFEPTGETEPWPYGDERYGVAKRPDLEFVVMAKEL